MVEESRCAHAWSCAALTAVTAATSSAHARGVGDGDLRARRQAPCRHRRRADRATLAACLAGCRCRAVQRSPRSIVAEVARPRAPQRRSFMASSLRFPPLRSEAARPDRDRVAPGRDSQSRRRRLRMKVAELSPIRRRRSQPLAGEARQQRDGDVICQRHRLGRVRSCVLRSYREGLGLDRVEFGLGDGSGVEQPLRPSISAAGPAEPATVRM